MLWGPPGPDGGRAVYARAVVALPREPHAQVAEAEGCVAALDLIGACCVRLRVAGIVGGHSRNSLHTVLALMKSLQRGTRA